MTDTTSNVYDQGRTMDPLTLADLIEAADLSDLLDNGDTHTLAPGYDVRLVVEHDPDCSVFDEEPDFIGRLQWSKSYDSNRPSSFNGAARILDSDYGRRLWWQPPVDLVKGWPGADPDRVDSMASYIKERLTDGYLYVALELIGPAPETTGWQYHDYHAHRPTITAAGIGGVDSTEHGYLATLIQEQQGELEHYVRQIPGSEHPTL